MILNSEQISILLGAIESVSEDSLDCDGCFDKVAEFSERELNGLEIPEALRAVEQHFANCPCCKNEYEALKAALKACEESSD